MLFIKNIEVALNLFCITPLLSTWNEFLHWLLFTIEPADGEGDERRDGNLGFGRSATVCTGAKEPWVHLCVFSTKMNIIELIFFFKLRLDTSKEKGRFYAFLTSAEMPQS